MENNGSDLRAVDALVSDVRTKVSQIKMMVNDLKTANKNERVILLDSILILLNEIDDRS